MTTRVCALLRVIAAAVVICGAVSAPRAAQFLSDEIESAIAARTDFLQRVNLADADFLTFGQWLQTRDREQFAERLSSLSETEDTWYYFLSGLMDAEIADTVFGYALLAASGDPGALWLLALEFIRNDKSQWANNAFTELEKKIFSLGAVSAPLLSRQLMLFGNVLAPNYPSDAEFCYGWAKRFDGDQFWWAYKKGFIDFPKNLSSAIPGFIEEAAGVFARSWRAQLAAAGQCYKFLSAALFIFMCAVFLVFFVKYMVPGTHTLGDTLFGAVGATPFFRALSSVALALSVLILGFLPFLWVGAFFVRRFLDAAEKKLLTVACVILTLTPLNAFAVHFFERHTASASTPVVFDRVVKEGFSSDLHKLAAENVAKNPGSHLNELAFAISAAKEGNYRQSADALRRAHQAAPADPMVLMHAGNISFWAGNIEGMEQFHNQLLAKNPKSAAAKYNLAQSHVDKGGFMSSDMISEAVKLNSPLISEFVKVNDQYYANDVPPLRKLIQPAITPEYFWANVFFSDLGSVFGASRKTGFFGLGSLVTFIIFAAALAALLAVDAFVWSDSETKSGRKYFICRICGRMLCRRCRKGTMCSRCYKANLDCHNNAAEMYYLQKRCLENTRLRRDITGCLFGMAVPGSERLYKGESVWKPAAVMMVTSAVFAALYCAFTFRAGYPSRAVMNPLFYASVLLIYNMAAFARHAGSLARVLQNFAKNRAKQG